AQFSHLSKMERKRSRLGSFSAGSVARPDSAFVFQLSPDGGAGDNLYRRNGGRGIFTLARKALRLAMDAVDFNDQRAFAVYREHRGMDDRGIGPPAVADLWIDAHGAGSFAARRRGQRVVHADWIYGDVHSAR